MTFTQIIASIIGTYVPVAGETGLASIDFVFVAGAAAFLMFLWFSLRLILNLFSVLFGGRK